MDDDGFETLELEPAGGIQDCAREYREEGRAPGDVYLLGDNHSWIAAESALSHWTAFAKYSSSCSLHIRIHHEGSCYLGLISHDRV